MKTPDEIFDWLVRNSSYYVRKTTTDDIITDGGINGRSLVITVYGFGYVPPFHAKYDDFVSFLGEDYSFKKHLVPLIDLELINCTMPGKPFNTKYKKIFNSTWGLVKNYETNEQFVCFWLGKKNPND